jgi:hypothetical protein
MGFNPHSGPIAAQFNTIVTGMKTSFTPFTILYVRYPIFYVAGNYSGLPLSNLNCPKNIFVISNDRPPSGWGEFFQERQFFRADVLALPAAGMERAVKRDRPLKIFFGEHD